MDKVENHFINTSVIVGENNYFQVVEICSCQIHNLVFRGSPIVAHPFKNGLTCYYPVKFKKGLHPNKLVSKALNKEIFGPVVIRYEDKDANEREILNILLSS